MQSQDVAVTISELALFLFSLLTSVAGQFFLKSGALRLGHVNAANALGLILNIIKTPDLLIGLSCYAVGAVAYILVLTRVNLSVAGPAISLSYVFALLVGHFVFKEPIPLKLYIGMGLIISGVILVIWRK